MWKTDVEAKPGDHIRVNRGMYYHHAIYIGDGYVVHFASEEGAEIKAETAVVHIASLKRFLNGGTLEVRVLSEEEKKEARSPEEVIKYALSCQGEKGYNLISNNCEHFANRCLFGESRSEQVEDIMNLLGSLFGGKK